MAKTGCCMRCIDFCWNKKTKRACVKTNIDPANLNVSEAPLKEIVQ